METGKIKSNREIANFIIALALLLTISIFIFKVAIAVPQGAVIISSSTENATVRPADSHVAQGGSFTTFVLNATSQTSKWKAYVGNVSGRITLDNSLNKTIYDWALTMVQGEVYVSRNESVNFGTLACANTSNVTSEQNILGINSTSDDSINNTFKNMVHRSFIIGGTGLISNSTCFAIATYVNDTTQSASEAATFQEVLLSDGRNLVYTSLLENRKQGFDTTSYDFQMIVPDDPTATSNTYYFYAELG